MDQRLGFDELPGGKLSGARKGRVIYLLAEGAPYGFLTYHFEDTGLPLVVQGAGALGPNDGYAAVETLLVALERVAQLLGADPALIYWDTDSSRFRDVALLHAFEARVTAPSAKAHELERIINYA